MTAQGGRGFAVLEGTVLEAVGGVYRIRLDDGRMVEASLRGRLKRDERRSRRSGERIVAGDRIRVAESEDGFTIEERLSRENALVRSGPGGRRPKLVAANVDRAVAVLSAKQPPFQAELADRFLALSETCGIPPVLVLNKADLAGAREVIDTVAPIYRTIGYPVIVTSARTGDGVDALGEEMRGVTCVVVGPSGAGKSTLLNALDPDLDLRTAPVSHKAGRGRHTTVSARLVPLSNLGWVVDTPGFSDVSLWGVAPAELATGFPELTGPSEECRFRECTHVHEPDCGVREAVDAGVIPESRYASYATLLEEARAARRWD